jgi:class 3 adenylate cyclase
MQPRIQMTSIDVIASALEPVTPVLSRMSSPDGAVTLMLSDIADASAAAEQLGPER